MQPCGLTGAVAPAMHGPSAVIAPDGYEKRCQTAHHTGARPYDARRARSTKQTALLVWCMKVRWRTPAGGLRFDSRTGPVYRARPGTSDRPLGAVATAPARPGRGATRMPAHEKSHSFRNSRAGLRAQYFDTDAAGQSIRPPPPLSLSRPNPNFRRATNFRTSQKSQCEAT